MQLFDRFPEQDSEPLIILDEIVINDTDKIERVSVTIPNNDILVRPKHKTVFAKNGWRIIDSYEVMYYNKTCAKPVRTEHTTGCCDPGPGFTFPDTPAGLMFGSSPIS